MWQIDVFSFRTSTAQMKTSSFWLKWQQVRFKFWWSLPRISQVCIKQKQTKKNLIKCLGHHLNGGKKRKCVLTVVFCPGRLPVSGSWGPDRSAEGLRRGGHVPALGSGFQQEDAQRTCRRAGGEDTQERWARLKRPGAVHWNAPHTQCSIWTDEQRCSVGECQDQSCFRYIINTSDRCDAAARRDADLLISGRVSVSPCFPLKNPALYYFWVHLFCDLRGMVLLATWFCSHFSFRSSFIYSSGAIDTKCWSLKKYSCVCELSLCQAGWTVRQRLMAALCARACVCEHAHPSAHLCTEWWGWELFTRKASLGGELSEETIVSYPNIRRAFVRLPPSEPRWHF